MIIACITNFIKVWLNQPYNFFYHFIKSLFNFDSSKINNHSSNNHTENRNVNNHPEKPRWSVDTSCAFTKAAVNIHVHTSKRRLAGIS